MVAGMTDFATTCFDNRSVLKVSTPKGVYTEKQIDDLYRQVRTHVGDEYLVVIVPDDVRLEIIV